MNPYEANLLNTSARIGAWLRGVLRMYRKPILLIASAGVVLAAGVAAGEAPRRDTLEAASR
jgi:hypothetical protein